MKKLFTTTILTLTLLSTTAQAKIVHWDNIQDFKKVDGYYKKLDKMQTPTIDLTRFKDYSGMRLLKEVDLYVNHNITYQSEPQGVDNWQTPEETLTLKTGDCEDYALLKMWILQQLGVNERDMYIEQGINETTSEFHAVLEIIDGSHVYYLDNMQEDLTHNSIKPLGAYTINRFGANFYIEGK